MTEIWFWLAALAMLATAIIHSVAGERRIIGPLLQSDASQVLGPGLDRIMRGAWHLTSLLMLLFGVVVVWPGTPDGAIIVIGLVWLILGIAILICSKGSHPGWPTLSMGGLFSLMGALL